MLVTSFVSKSGNNISIESPYTIVCRGVKTSSTVKKTICHKVEKQFSQLAGKIDKKSNGFIKRIKASKV
jgi:hypothetical protein